MNVNARMLELSRLWNEQHPQATKEQQQSAFDKIAAHVVHEMMRGYEMPLDLGTLV